jgi:hypothetical protein
MYSLRASRRSQQLDDFGGAAPITSLPVPSPYSAENAAFGFDIANLTGGLLNISKGQSNLQEQFNFVDTLSVQHGSHALKFGVDYRRLSPQLDPPLYRQLALFGDVSSAQSGNLLLSYIASSKASTLLFRNVGAFAQDTWRATSRLTLTYGLRWDVDVAPDAIEGPRFPAVTGYDLNNLASLRLAPSGTPPFRTQYGNLAPRLGVAYELFPSASWATVLRAGAGIFHDLASGQIGNLIWQSAYPYGASKFGFGGTFPLDASAAAPAPLVVPGGGEGTITAFNPHLKLPYTTEWSAAVEQGLGKRQSLSLTYVGASGQDLIQTADIFPIQADFSQAILVDNTAASNYNSLQVQFRRQAAQGLDLLSSYTWSHSIDDASAGSFGSTSNTYVPGQRAQNRGPSDFDIRHSFSFGMSYEVPSPKINPWLAAIARGWSLQSLVQAHSAPPVNVSDSELSTLLNGVAAVRPDVVQGEQFYLYGPSYPGGKAFNPAAFTPPPLDPNTGAPLRQGDLSRNALRGFDLVQWDFAIHRDFPLHESIRLQFRAELFNVLNHPNFASPIGNIFDPRFGLSTQMLGQSLSNGNVAGGGGLSPLYQLGGPRSVQFALKLFF